MVSTTIKEKTMKTFKGKVFLVLLDRLVELEAALAAGYQVQRQLDQVHWILRELPNIDVVPRATPPQNQTEAVEVPRLN